MAITDYPEQLRHTVRVLRALHISQHPEKRENFSNPPNRLKALKTETFQLELWMVEEHFFLVATVTPVDQARLVQMGRVKLSSAVAHTGLARTFEAFVKWYDEEGSDLLKSQGFAFCGFGEGALYAICLAHLFRKRKNVENVHVYAVQMSDHYGGEMESLVMNNLMIHRIGDVKDYFHHPVRPYVRERICITTRNINIDNFECFTEEDCQAFPKQHHTPSEFLKSLGKLVKSHKGSAHSHTPSATQ